MHDFIAALVEIREAGFLVNNLFQIDDNQWQANLYHPAMKGGYEFAKDTNPVRALLLCFEKAKAELPDHDLA